LLICGLYETCRGELHSRPRRKSPGAASDAADGRGSKLTVPRGPGSWRHLTAARLMILLYAWGFPCLWFVHGDACPYARLPECNGFASEHHDADRSGDPLIHNLHV